MRLAFSFFFIYCCPASIAQSLIVNGGFEDHDGCPGDYIQSPHEFRVKQWHSASAGTPDYFNACSFGEADVPHNWAGVADAYEGAGYAGLYLWMDLQNNYREYLQTALLQPLLKDSLYYLEFHYKLSSYSKYSIDRIGLLLTDTLVRLKHDRVFKVTPTFSVKKDSALTKETGLWEEAKIIYKAKGGERFLLLGNFFDDNSTKVYKIQFRPTPQPMVAQSAYYYIDDVSVVPKFLRDQQNLARTVPEFDLDRTTLNTTYVLKNINFKFDSYQLIPPSFSALDKLADYMLRHSEVRLQLFGHTDDQGSEQYNLKLSQARAKNVAEYLVSVGIAQDRIEYFGYGKSRPVVADKTEEARAINRRVEIRFVGPDR